MKLRVETTADLAHAAESAVAEFYVDDTPWPPRPLTRGDCVGGQRPCPWAGCRHHLMLNVSRNGTIWHAFDDIDDMPATCSLDVADENIERNRVDVARFMGTRDARIYEIEKVATEKARRQLALFQDHVPAYDATGDEHDIAPAHALDRGMLGMGTARRIVK